MEIYSLAVVISTITMAVIVERQKRQINDCETVINRQYATFIFTSFLLLYLGISTVNITM